MLRLVANFGEPWGRDASMGEIMAAEWERALAHLPAVALDDAVSQWIDRNITWPRPAQLLALADKMLSRKVGEASEQHGLHPSRIDPAETMKGFFYKSADALRVNPVWRKFLDGLHPTIEHCFFKNAKCGRYAHEVDGMNSFEIGYVLQNYGDAMAKLFGRPIHFRAKDQNSNFKSAPMAAE